MATQDDAMSAAIDYLAELVQNKEAQDGHRLEAAREILKYTLGMAH